MLLQSACWAMAKSWLDVQVDKELARLQPGGMDQFKSYEEAIEETPEQGDGGQQIAGPDNWPLQVLNQQPRHLAALLQKLHSRLRFHVYPLWVFYWYSMTISISKFCSYSDTVHEAVTRACKEQQRLIEVMIFLKGILVSEKIANLNSGII